MPYTYLVTHVPTGLRYYGVRYAKDSTPDDLWDTYFTSSKYVKELLESDGKNSFIFEIRRVFNTGEAAIAWETKVLRRLKVPYNHRYINRGTNHPQSQQEKQESFFRKYGVYFPSHVEEIKQKTRETWMRNYGVDHPNKSHLIQERQRRVLLEKYNVEYTWNIPGVFDKSRGTMIERYGVEFAMQSDQILQKSFQTQIEKYGGWRCQSPDVVDKVRQSNLDRYGVDNPFKLPGFAKQKAREKYGVDNFSQTEAGKRAIREGWAARDPIVCPHCGKESKAFSNMKRWHFDNCKHKG